MQVQTINLPKIDESIQYALENGLWLNATEVAKRHNKRLDNYFTSPNTIEYMNELCYFNSLDIRELKISKVYNKRHGDLMRTIREHIDKITKLRGENYLNAKVRLDNHYQKLSNGKIRKTPFYLLDRDIFNIIVLKFQGLKAMDYTLKFIDAFNAMEKKLLENDALLAKEQEELAKYSSIRGLQPKAENFGELSTTGNGCSRVNYVRAYVRSSRKDPISVLMGLKRQWEDRKVEAGLFGEWSAEEIADTIKAIDIELNKLMTKSVREGLERKANHASIEHKT